MKKMFYNTLADIYLYLYYCSVNVFYNVFKRFLFFPRFLRFLTFFYFFPNVFYIYEWGHAGLPYELLQFYFGRYLQ